MTVETASNEKTVQRFLQAFEAADEHALREMLAPEFVAHSVPPGFTNGADGLVELAKQLKAGMPDGKFTIHDIFAAANKVAVRFTHAGTQRGDLFGVPASGRTVTIPAIEIYHLSSEKIAEYWGEYNTSDLFGPPAGMDAAGGGAQQQS
jgi:steroid delta-isomerase-like uncharacterized protein